MAARDKDGEAETDHSPSGLFEFGPPRGIPVLLRLPNPLFAKYRTRLLFVLMASWGILALLVLAAPLFGFANQSSSFVHDIDVHARHLLAAPLLIVALPASARRMGRAVHQFFRTGLLTENERDRMAQALARARTRIESPAAELTVIALAYGLTIALFCLADPRLAFKPWQFWDRGNMPSPAGAWYALVSFPLLLMLVLGWIWRVFVWARLLREVSAFDLHLIAAHPDRCGGLGFLAQSVRAFTVVGLAIGTIFAGRFAALHVAGLSSPIRDGVLVGGVVVLALLLCVAPLAAFSTALAECWRSGVVAYGALATEFGKKFERKWLYGGRTDDDDILTSPEFSAGTDYYQMASNVQSMRFIPVDLQSVLMLLGATLVPFIPAMFLTMPADVVISELMGLLH